MSYIYIYIHNYMYTHHNIVTRATGRPAASPGGGERGPETRKVPPVSRCCCS